MLTLYITRHGETVWNTQQRLQGWKDSDLTEKGIQNALALGARLKDTEFQSIYTSSSNRTIKTTELISGDRQQPIFQDDNLREINLGDWEGKTADYLDAHFPEEYYSFSYTPHLYKSESGESFSELQERVQKVLQRIKSENSSGNVLIVTHSVVVKALLAYCKNTPLQELWSGAYIHDTSLTIVEMTDLGIEVKLEGDVTHRMERVKTSEDNK